MHGRDAMVVVAVVVIVSIVCECRRSRVMLVAFSDTRVLLSIEGFVDTTSTLPIPLENYGDRVND